MVCVLGAGRVEIASFAGFRCHKVNWIDSIRGGSVLVKIILGDGLFYLPKTCHDLFCMVHLRVLVVANTENGNVRTLLVMEYCVVLIKLAGARYKYGFRNNNTEDGF